TSPGRSGASTADTTCDRWGAGRRVRRRRPHPGRAGDGTPARTTEENEMPNLAELLSRSVAERPDHVAVKLDDIELSYAALDDAAARMAALLREKGVEPGDRVGIMLPNVASFAVCYYGALRAGAAVVTMNGLLKE